MQAIYKLLLLKKKLYVKKCKKIQKRKNNLKKKKKTRTNRYLFFYFHCESNAVFIRFPSIIQVKYKEILDCFHVGALKCQILWFKTFLRFHWNALCIANCTMNALFWSLLFDFKWPKQNIIQNLGDFRRNIVDCNVLFVRDIGTKLLSFWWTCECEFHDFL